MRLALCRICEHADQLASSGNPVLIGLFNHMHTSGFPARLERCYLAIELETDPGEAHREFDLLVRLIDEDGRALTEQGGRFQVGDGMPARTMRTFFAMPLPWDDRFVFPAPGRYRFDVIRRDDQGNEHILGGETLSVFGI